MRAALIRRSYPLLFAASIAAMAACAGSNGGTSIPANGQAASGDRDRGKLALRITVPRRHRSGHVRRKPQYVSPSTKALTLQIDGPTSVPSEVVGLTGSSPGCTTASGSTNCTLTIPGLAPCPSSSNCYSASIATYDAYDGANDTIPPSAKELSAAQNVGFKIVKGQTYAISITLGGLPASVVLDPLPSSTLSGNMTDGFTEDRCFQSDSVQVLGVDADGNDILGAGGPKPTLTSDDPVHIAVSTPPPSAPNTFALRRPPEAIPTPGSTVHLTATVKPLSGTGASTQSAVASVKFDQNESCGIIGNVTQYNLPWESAFPGYITAGPDKALWFANQSGDVDSIARVTTSGTFSSFPLSRSSKPVGIAAGPDGAMWFTEELADKIGRVTTSGTITEYTAGLSASSDPYCIVAGSDGALWFTELIGNRIGRITTTGTITEYSVPSASSWPLGIAAGPDGAIWFTEVYGTNFSAASKIGRITTGGTITEYPIPTSESYPYSIVAGPDGAMWFTEYHANQIGRITTKGAVTEYHVPTANSVPYGIAAGSDGALWFTEYNASQIARMTTDGNVNEIAVPTAGSTPYGITAGPDGALWFTEVQGNKIGRI